MVQSLFSEKESKVITSIRNYLLESGQQACAIALDKAISEIISFDSTGRYKNNYSNKTNSLLCEALIIANMDNSCSEQNKALLRALIESYREVYGLSTEDFEYIV